MNLFGWSLIIDLSSIYVQEVSLEEILERQAVQQQEKEESDRLRAKAFKERGLTYTSETTYEDMY